MIISETRVRSHRSTRYGVLMRVVFSSLLTIVALASPLNGQTAPPDPNDSASTSQVDDELPLRGRERLAIVCTIVLLALIYTTVYSFLRDFVAKKTPVWRFALPWVVLGVLVGLASLAWGLTSPLETVTGDPTTASTTSQDASWFESITGRFSPRNSWFATVTLPELTLLIVSTFGPLGGVLCTMFDGTLSLPRYDRTKKEIKLGYIVDCAYGWGGAFAVFLVLPTDINLGTNLMKGIATAFVAGYAGRAIIAKALGQLTARINEVAGTIENEDKALTMSREQLEGKTVDQNKLTQAIEESSPTGRTLIFNEAMQVLQDYSEFPSERVARTVPIFKALVKSDEEHDQLQRYHAALGRALMKGKEDFAAAEKSFTDAIRIRDKEVKGANVDRDYEFYRAVCRISMPESDQDKDEIIKDLTNAAKDSDVRRLYNKKKKEPKSDAETISKWRDMLNKQYKEAGKDEVLVLDLDE
jgi:hypothetical protein